MPAVCLNPYVRGVLSTHHNERSCFPACSGQRWFVRRVVLCLGGYPTPRSWKSGVLAPRVGRPIRALIVEVADAVMQETGLWPSDNDKIVKAETEAEMKQSTKEGAQDNLRGKAEVPGGKLVGPA